MDNKQAIVEAIIARYTEEARQEACLSCGTVLNEANVLPGEVVLDLGCGKGHDAVRAAQLAGREGKAYGLDLTPAMLEAAGIYAKKAELENVEFLQGTLEEIPLPAESVDVVISNCTINHSIAKLRVYQEIFRVLKPGGRFVISDVLAEEELPPAVTEDPQAWAECYGGSVIVEEYYNLINKAGFPHLNTLKSRSYLKKGYKLASHTIQAFKPAN